MNGYMISIVGIFMIFLYSLLILLVFYLLGRLLRRWLPRWRWVLLTLLSPLVLALLSLPWLEEAWISWHFNKACEDA
ncbi:MAG: hypothetical protein LBJ59_04395, partial [Zoogloeaceae bacterium]|nr:hypothetical protein [Zoogloeaceae bacterium]